MTAKPAPEDFSGAVIVSGRGGRNEIVFTGNEENLSHFIAKETEIYANIPILTCRGNTHIIKIDKSLPARQQGSNGKDKQEIYYRIGGVCIKEKKTDVFVIGFALFSMFFGAGNVIFPPYLGLGAGPEWVIGFLCYYMADIGLALVALFAMLRCGGTDGLTASLGKIPAAILMTAIVLCIGPMLAIPRTGATTFELSVQPLFGGLSSVVFSILYFAVILALCIRESAVVDIIGKFLTPVMFVGLLVLIVVGIVRPLGPIAEVPALENVPGEGVISGYQTMDVLATLVFGFIILKSAEDKGYTDERSRKKIVAGAGLVAAVGLLVVYMGLSYLGATVSTMYTMDINRSVLVLAIVEQLLGKAGLVIFAVVVGLACVTTAVGLTSAAAAYFETLFNGRLSYKTLTIIICVCSAVFSNFGLDQIISISAPILNIVYPPTLVIILMAMLKKWFPEKEVHRMAALGALLVSVMDVLNSLGLPLPFLAKLPLAGIGFGWVVPAALFAVLAVIFFRKDSRADDDDDDEGEAAAEPDAV